MISVLSGTSKGLSAQRSSLVKATNALKLHRPAARAVNHFSRTDLQQQVLETKISCRSLTRVGVSRREGVFLFGFGGNDDDDEEEIYTVCKLQVGMFGDINKWQSKLDQIATKYDTGDEEGLHHIFTDSLMLVLRNMEYAGYATSAGKTFDNIDDAEQKFNSVLMEERLKFKEETLVNVDGRKKTSVLEAKGSEEGLDRWLCMTLLMAVEGKIKIPKIGSPYELKQVLTNLGGISADNLVAIELLWTPQETNDSYSRQELLEDYPSLVTLT
ncbi:hypothetical protein CEUSTIGMA_g4750.t1 [Chlamydomonas eustigma]|uniref:DUF1517 domain-containing protein n=1 Tax=Chlamydomonas eustigma TaxID=1157962 RepID=A0A250X2I0_9CHLO|nr:hypothetical protein CEUSTIGMA_g4750.t1 [Chlamydomonas eustigma]|eukprot:GAX77304.1 hypothetical protein CEUSTIGMA_g4750.t1 [Chlamydomonas eustigma]